MRLLIPASLVFLLAQVGFSQATPPQTARQALIEMFFGTAPNHLEKHLPDITRTTLKKLPSANGMNALEEFSMIATQMKAGGGKFETFETGPILISAEDPRDGGKFELTVERDDLTGEEDQIELALHVIRNYKEESLPFIPRFTFAMTQESDVWRLSEIDVTIKVPLADPAFLKAIEEEQRRQSEQMTMWAMQSILTSEKTYSAAQGGYACTLQALADSKGHNKYLWDPDLASGKKSGYIFVISSCDTGHFKLVAEPETPNSGQRAFCTDEGGTIRASGDGKATSCLSSGEMVRDTAGSAPGVAVAAPSKSQPATANGTQEKQPRPSQGPK